MYQGLGQRALITSAQIPCARAQPQGSSNCEKLVLYSVRGAITKYRRLGGL